MGDTIEVLDAKITIRSTLSFLTDVKNKLQEPRNENRKTLFRATVFGKWLYIPAFANDNHLLNYIFHHQGMFVASIIVFMGREPRYYIPDNVLESVDDLPDQDSAFQNMDMDDNIHSSVHLEEQNSPVMDKEDLLVVFDGIEAKVHIIDKRKGEVATSCLVKELDLVKDRIAVIEKALKLSAVSDVFHQVVTSETHHCPGEGSGFIYADSQDQFLVSQLLQVATNKKSKPVIDCTQLEGSVGFDNVLDPDCKDEFGDDNDQEGLVKLVDDLCIEEQISSNVVDAKVVDKKVLDDKVLDEKVLDAKVVDEKGQAISRLTATKGQQPPSDHQVYAGVGVDVHVDDVQCAQKPALNEFIEVSLIIKVI
nr:phospholipase-like protein [Tanacetum cinerariifolium]